MKKNKHIKSYFEFKEVIIIVFAFVVISASISGYLVYLYIMGGVDSNKYLDDIVVSYNKIKKDYYEQLNEEELSSAAINGMMNYLGEKYSKFLDDDETDDLNEKLNSSYKGIGIKIISSNDTITVYDIFDDSPAKKAGLKVGDILLKVNDKSVKDMDMNSIVSMIQNSKKEINLTVRRKDEEVKLTVDVENIDTPVCDGTILDEDNHIGYIQLTNFSDTSYKQFSSSLKKLEEKEVKSLIIDLRSNTGGYLKEAEKIASLFLKKGDIIYYLDDKSGKKEVYKDKTKESLDIPVVVLINEVTASASEVLASSLKESYGAILVGKKTYGKGKVQQTSKLSDNQSIKYTTSKWYTPSNKCIDGIGLNPGIEVGLGKEYIKNPSLKTDAQLQKALSILKNND